MQMTQLYRELLTAIHFDTLWNIESAWKRYHNYTDLMRSENYFKVFDIPFFLHFYIFSFLCIAIFTAQK